MINTTLAKRYAHALIEIGLEKKALETYNEQLQGINQMVEGSGEFRQVLTSPVFTREDKKDITGDILKKMDVDPMISNFISLLIDRKRIDQLPGIVRAFADQVDAIQGITRGKVISADPLTEDELGQVTAALSKISDKRVMVTAEVDPSYIGGLVAKVGDMVFDGTIRTQLNQLKQSLKG